VPKLDETKRTELGLMASEAERLWSDAGLLPV